MTISARHRNHILPTSFNLLIPPVCVIVVFGKTESVGGRRHDTESEDTAEHDEDDGEGVEVSTHTTHTEGPDCYDLNSEVTRLVRVSTLYGAALYRMLT